MIKNPSVITPFLESRGAGERGSRGAEIRELRSGWEKIIKGVIEPDSV
jgi:hypothetical protein